MSEQMGEFSNAERFQTVKLECQVSDSLSTICHCEQL